MRKFSRTTVLLLAVIALGVFLVTKFFNDPIQKLANGIAKAEGFGDDPGNLPTRNNNPGDLKAGDVGLGLDQGKTIYPTALAGWAALYKQVVLMLTNTSRIYTRDMTITELSQVWINGSRGNDAGNAPEWAQTVADYCQVTVDTKLEEIV